MSRYIDITGRNYGRLTVVGFEGISDTREAIFRVRCSCGVEFSVLSKNIRFGRTLSCGCFRKEITAQNNKKRRKAI